MPTSPTQAAPSAEHRYIVQPGDTLTSIAARFGTDWHTVYFANRAGIGDDADRLLPGQKLTIPPASRP
jgi:nucleoid-associated protein YgaU